MPEFRLIPLDRVDPVAVESLLDRAFGRERRGRTAYRLREGVDAIASLSFAAVEADDTLVGSIHCWPVALSPDQGAALPMVMVGPVAVAPERQGGGIGRALVERSIAAADESALGGAERLMMIGDPDYYERFFGFSAAATAGWRLPGPVERHRLLLRASDPIPVAAAGEIVPRHLTTDA